MLLPLHCFRMRLALILATLLIATTARWQIQPAPTAAESAGQTLKFKVLVLDALDGKPQIGVEVTSFCEGVGYIPHNEVKSGSDGVAEEAYQCKEGAEQITVDVPGEAKGECGGLGALKLSNMSRWIIRAAWVDASALAACITCRQAGSPRVPR